MTHTRFTRVGRWHRGYRPRQVEVFLDRVETALTGQGIVAEVTAADVRRVGFDLVRHGYSPREVDQALESIELRVLEHEAKPVGRRGQVDPFREAAFLSQELGHPYGHRFPRAPRLRRGYDVDDVDDFTDLILATLQGTYRLSHTEVRSALFARRRHGYDEDAVDELLDRVIEFLLQPGTADVLPPAPIHPVVAGSLATALTAEPESPPEPARSTAASVLPAAATTPVSPAPSWEPPPVLPSPAAPAYETSPAPAYEPEPAAAYEPGPAAHETASPPEPPAPPADEPPTWPTWGPPAQPAFDPAYERPRRRRFELEPDEAEDDEEEPWLPFSSDS